MNISEDDWISYEHPSGWIGEAKVIETKPEGDLIVGQHDNDPDTREVSTEDVVEKITGSKNSVTTSNGLTISEGDWVVYMHRAISREGKVLEIHPEGKLVVGQNNTDDDTIMIAPEEIKEKEN